MTRVAVVTMKPALRGRIRREITTLLDVGHDVLVTGLRTPEDFAHGLDHPRLRVELVKPTSAYTRTLGALRKLAHVVWPSRWQGSEQAVPAHLAQSAAPPVSPAPAVAAPAEERQTSVANGAVRAVVRPVWVLLVSALKQLLRPGHRVTLYRHFWDQAAGIVEAWQPDIVQSCDLEGLVAAGRVAVALDVPHLHDCHELFLERANFSRFERALLARVEQRWIVRADAVTVVNASIGEELTSRYGIDTVVFRNCADRPAQLADVDVRVLAGLEPGTTVVLFQGGLQPGRGLAELVRAAELLPEGAALVLLGYGRLGPDLRRLADRLGITERVRIVAAVPPDELLAVTASADVGVVPYQPVSMNNRLCLPNKIFEYLSVGVPVAVSDLPELRRVVDESGAGRTFDPYDPASIAVAITDLLAPEAHGEAAASAKEYGAKNTWDIEKARYLDAYTRLLAERRADSSR